MPFSPPTEENWTHSLILLFFSLLVGGGHPYHRFRRLAKKDGTIPLA